MAAVLQEEQIMTNNKDSVASYIGSGASKRGPFYCNHCNRKLDCLDQDTREYLCTYCNISYYPDYQNVKRANKFETPGPETDIHGNVLTQDKPLLAAICPETWTKKKGLALKKQFDDSENNVCLVTSLD
jgi:hypothetical protein